MQVHVMLRRHVAWGRTDATQWRGIRSLDPVAGAMRGAPTMVVGSDRWTQ